jgi:hypothetical protein
MSTRTQSLDVLNGAQFMSLTTYKKNGDAVPTPVLFARDGDKVYCFTLANAGKAKRIRNNGKVQVAPCDRAGKILGESVEATARLITGDDIKAANRALNAKYGLMKRFFDLLQIRRDRAYIEVTAP